jgi:NitT/TauT family transport system substrate-binding protein
MMPTISLGRLANLLRRCIATTVLCLVSGALSAQERVHFQYSWLPTGEYAPISAAIERGVFRRHGIDLTYSTGRGSGDAVRRIASGASPFGDGDISAVIDARIRENAPVRCIMAQHVMSPHSLFVLESSGITNISQLAGRTLATTPGNSHFIYFPLVARLNGLDPASVRWITVDSTAMAPMLIAGRVDGAPLFATHLYYQNKQAERVGRRIRAIPFAEHGFRIYSYCWTATEETLRANPDLVRRFLAGVHEAYIWAHSNVDEAARLHQRRHPDVAADDAAGSMRIMYQYMFPTPEAVATFGQFEIGRLRDTYRVVAQAQNHPADADVTQFIDTRFVPTSR